MSEISQRENGGYNGAAVLGGVLATAFFPLISLIAALLLQGSQPDPIKRGQLHRWAWISGAWLVVHAIIIALFVYLAFRVVHPSP
jgi:uncharacterized membrane protein